MSKILETVMLDNKKIIIAGPCAMESKIHLRNTIRGLKQLGVKAIRASLWKPRTKPDWDGCGIYGLFFLLEETLPYGLIPATEILTEAQAIFVMEGLKAYDPKARLIVWIGARNQNHFEQKAIAKILANYPESVILMFKNQMWEDLEHWIGIYGHLVAAGFSPSNIITCHRGFAPGSMPNPSKLRNLPNFNMAMAIKSRLGIPILLDPSHIGGSVPNVISIFEDSLSFPFDGYLIEVHDKPVHAKTDAGQQLSLSQFETLLNALFSQATLNNEIII